MVAQENTLVDEEQRRSRGELHRKAVLDGCVRCLQERAHDHRVGGARCLDSLRKHGRQGQPHGIQSEDGKL